MKYFERQFRHNTWANAVMADAASGAHAGVVDRELAGGDSIVARIEHLAVVERGFLSLLQGRMERPQAPANAAAAAALLRETGDGFVAIVRSANAARLEDGVPVPRWNGQQFATGDILSQVLAHSGQHRSEVCLALLDAGVNTGEIDYIRWVAAGEPGPGEPARVPGELLARKLATAAMPSSQFWRWARPLVRAGLKSWSPSASQWSRIAGDMW